MICKSCAIAGDMVAEVRDKPILNVPIASLEVPISTHAAVRSVAYVFHGLCKGSTHCDCQHKVDFEGKAIANGQASG